MRQDKLTFQEIMTTANSFNINIKSMPETLNGRSIKNGRKHKARKH